MATPTTSKMDASPAAARPTAHAASFKTQDQRSGAAPFAGAFCLSGEAVSLEGIGGLLGQPTRRGLRAIIKIPASVLGQFEEIFKHFGFQKIVTSAESCYKTLQ
jgi:hypothetical protein